eukprot:706154_1
MISNNLWLSIVLLIASFINESQSSSCTTPADCNWCAFENNFEIANCVDGTCLCVNEAKTEDTNLDFSYNNKNPYIFIGSNSYMIALFILGLIIGSCVTGSLWKCHQAEQMKFISKQEFQDIESDVPMGSENDK